MEQYTGEDQPGNRKVRTQFSSLERFLRLFARVRPNEGATSLILAANLIDRLKHQIGRPKDYYQTSNYFGPDRRLNEPPDAARQHGVCLDLDSQFFAERERVILIRIIAAIV